MENSVKFYTGGLECDDEQQVKQESKISDLLRQQPLSKKIKINGSEKNPFKAFELQKFPSFHEALGLALTGFLHPLPSLVEN